MLIKLIYTFYVYLIIIYPFGYDVRTYDIIYRLLREVLALLRLRRFNREDGYRHSTENIYSAVFVVPHTQTKNLPAVSEVSLAKRPCNGAKVTKNK